MHLLQFCGSQHPDWIILKTEAKNAFDSVSCPLFLRQVAQHFPALPYKRKVSRITNFAVYAVQIPSEKFFKLNICAELFSTRAISNHAQDLALLCLMSTALYQRLFRRRPLLRQMKKSKPQLTRNRGRSERVARTPSLVPKKRQKWGEEPHRTGSQQQFATLR